MARADLPYLVSQQHVPDLSQILLGEHKAHVPTDMRQQPEGKMTAFSSASQTTSPPPRQRIHEYIEMVLPTFLRQGYSPDDHE